MYDTSAFYHYLPFTEKCIGCFGVVRSEVRRINANVSHLMSTDTFSEHGKCPHCGHDPSEKE
jgi:predicted RecB family nuclease